MVSCRIQKGFGVHVELKQSFVVRMEWLLEAHIESFEASALPPLGRVPSLTVGAKLWDHNHPLRHERVEVLLWLQDIQDPSIALATLAVIYSKSICGDSGGSGQGGSRTTDLQSFYIQSLEFDCKS